MSISKFPARALLSVAVAAFGSLGFSAHAAKVALARLDCGSEPAPVSVASFSDTLAHSELKLPLTYSCYLLRHGDRYLLWDTGMALDGAPHAPRASLVDQLARIKVRGDAVEYVGVSHHHYDHTGQLASFPTARLLIGQGDWDLVRANEPPAGMNAKDLAAQRARFAPWISADGKVEPLTRDRRDVFGDGRVLMISLPGHTPGHHGLLVKLEKTGYVLLTGDVTHFHENYRTDGVPDVE